MSSRDREKRLKVLGNVGLVALAVATAGVVASVTLPGGSTPPPVPDKVSEYVASPPPPYKPADVPVAAFVGDSYTTGSGAAFQGNRWTTRVAQKMGWYELNMGSPGAAYLNVGRGSGCPEGGCPSFSTLADKVVAASQTDFVIVAGGRADSGQDPNAVASAARSFFTTVRAGLPSAKVLVIGPMWDARNPPAELGRLGSLLEEEATAAGAKYLDIGGFFVGKPELIGPDGVHPTDEGYEAFYSSVIGPIQEAAAS